MDGKTCNKEELEIMLIALSDFRVRNLENNLYQDEKIRELILKIQSKNKEVEVID